MSDAIPTDDRRRWTDRARKVTRLAEQDAQARGHDHVSPQHYLFALLTEGESVGLRVLVSMGVPVGTLGAELDQQLGHAGGGSNRAPTPTTQLDQALRMAHTESKVAGAGFLSTEHLLIGLACDAGVGAALARWDVTPCRIRAKIHEFLSAFSRRCPPSRERRMEPAFDVPDDIRELGERIDRLRQEKERAVDAQDFEAATEIRSAEKDILRRRADRIREWSSQVDTVTLAQEYVALHDRIRGSR
ncbi:Clp protease N-terminal domain-containing protein [Micromonospora sp. NPDC002389]|uniref:Clp protease N-terminal domain-containing protein n=1 Tax=Micromonospora sp. NPDC002389 TaxID=3154272 RepID=UPI0033203D6B